MTTLQDIYGQAASVRSQTGVDPAIIAAIMSTETNVNRLPITLGITTGAPTGRGSSGLSVGTSTPGAVALGQPGAFWGYRDGAEAAVAFSNYIRNSGIYNYAVSDLGNAQKFFADLTANNSNYYVPMPGGESKAQYYGHWGTVASQFSNANGNQDMAPDTSVAGANTIASAAALVTAQSDTSSAPSLFGNTDLGKIVSRAASPGFWWSVGFFVLAAAMILLGLVIYFRKDITSVAGRAIAAA